MCKMISDWFSLIICVNNPSSIYDLKMFLIDLAIENVTINILWRKTNKVSMSLICLLIMISMCLSVYGESLRWFLISCIMSFED
jgi:hypothetical protein